MKKVILTMHSWNTEPEIESAMNVTYEEIGKCIEEFKSSGGPRRSIYDIQPDGKMDITHLDFK